MYCVRSSSVFGSLELRHHPMLLKYLLNWSEFNYVFLFDHQMIWFPFQTVLLFADDLENASNIQAKYVMKT